MKTHTLRLRNRIAAGALRPLGISPHLAPKPRRRTAISTVTYASSPGGPPDARRLTIIHFNDVYDISSRTIEPVGGAARFTHLIRGYDAQRPLILFSGDCLNPSLLSAFTRGEQMVPVLNIIGVHAAAVGNHDFDFGVEVLQEHMKSFKFPWLLSNVLDLNGEPLGGAQRSTIIDWEGVRVGLVGLVEREWLLTIPSIEADKDIIFLDFVEEGRRLAKELRSQGAEIIIALTHMRHPNDQALAAAVPEIQLLLGGHDHDYKVESVGPYNTMLFKSGTDFREFSVIHMTVPEPVIKSQLNSSTNGTGVYSGSTSSGGSSNGSGSNNSNNSSKGLVPARPMITWERIEVTAQTPEDPGVAAIVAGYQEIMGTRMDAPLGRSFVPLDAEFETVRSRESNAGNLLGDIMKLGLGADCAFFNGGTIRSGTVHPAGRLTMRDFVSMLPFTDELVVLRLSGADVVTALETGLSSWPKLEGRFLQVSGICFQYDSGLPSGQRIIPGSVTIAGEPLQQDKIYKVATKAYLRSGKDGFDALKRAQVEVDGETAPRLATLVHYLLTRIEELNMQSGVNTDESADEEGGNGSGFGNNNENARMGGSNGSGTTAEVLGASAAVATAMALEEEDIYLERVLCAVSEAPVPPAPCAHGLDALYRYDRASGQFGIAPMVDGRITNVAKKV